MAGNIDLEELAQEEARERAKRDTTTSHDPSDSMDITILETLHKIGQTEEALPGVRPRILKMVMDGEIQVFGIRTPARPPVFLSDVTQANFEKWATSTDGAAKVRKVFLAEAGFLSSPIRQERVALHPAPRVKHKLRQDSLDVAIDKAAAEAGGLRTAAVYLKLRELALNGESPFTGQTDGDSLCFTNDKNEPDKFTKNALAARLKRRAEPSVGNA
ncbi:MAG: hypothetical protein M3Y65_05530 [Pseudomonadota bacterium]|nr:hypothetical protein [Pseudomonadota bacterium]